MNIGELLAMEMSQEAEATKKVLERLPDDKFDWQPHEKSMTMGALASHVVNSLGWTQATLQTDGLDMETADFTPEEFHNSADAVAGFERMLKDATGMLKAASDEEMMAGWTLSEGEKVYVTMPKASVIRSFVMNHGIHHRAQLQMYLRLNDIPAPQIYGPTADEPHM